MSRRKGTVEKGATPRREVDGGKVPAAGGPPAAGRPVVGPGKALKATALPGPVRVLVVSARSTEREGVIAKLGGPQREPATPAGARPMQCVGADSAPGALAALEAGAFDLVMIDCGHPGAPGHALLDEMAAKYPGLPTIVLSDRPTLDEAVSAMRSGVADILPIAGEAVDIGSRARAVLARAEATRQRAVDVRRLKKVCRRLNTARQQVSRQVGSLCNDLVKAYTELSEQMTQLSVAGEFNSLIRQELDVESLLRSALEYVLSKTGPTNAAVFLPSTSSDYSLGAYVNYDCAKDTVDVMLEQLAGVVSPRAERLSDVLWLEAGKDVAEFLGEESHWVGESEVVVFPCRHDGECLAVVLLFRDKRMPFEESTLLPTLRVIAELFGKQLARVIHVHHRHLPKDQWGGFGAADDDSGTAA